MGVRDDLNCYMQRNESKLDPTGWDPPLLELPDGYCQIL